MKAEIKYFVWAVGLGVGLVVYAQTNFTTKNEGKMIFKSVEKLDRKMDRVINFLMRGKK